MISLQFYLQSFTSLSVIPESLTERPQSIDWLIVSLLFTSFILVALVRLMQSNIFGSLLVANAKFKGVQAYLKETVPLAYRTTGLLVFNYLVSFSALLYLLVRDYGLEPSANWVLIVFVPFIWFTWTLITMYFSQWITGESDVFQEPIIHKLIAVQLKGLTFFTLAVLWLLNGDFKEYFVWAAVGLLVFDFLFRIMKASVSSLRKGVPWYYIILYFCTLEILPLMVVYISVSQDFTRIFTK